MNLGRIRVVVVMLGLAAVSVGCGGPSQVALRTFPSTPRAVSELQRGWADAVIGDYPVMAYAARESTGRLEVVGEQFETGTFGIGVSKNAADLNTAITAALRKIMESEAYINILRNWAIHLGKVDPPVGMGAEPADEIVQLKDGKLHVGVELAFPPMEFYNELKHEAGADVEIAKAIAKEIGVEIEFVNMDFDSLIGAVESGQVDVAISSITITPERSQRIDFIPYLEAGSGILVIMGNPARLQRPKDLCGHTVALQEGTSQVDLVKAIPCE